MYNPAAPIGKTAFARILGDNHLWTSSLIELLGVAQRIVNRVIRVSPNAHTDVDVDSTKTAIQSVRSNLLELDKICSNPGYIRRFMASPESFNLIINNPAIVKRNIADASRACKPLTCYSNQVLFRNWVDTKGDKARIISDVECNKLGTKLYNELRDVHFHNVKSTFDTLYDHYYLGNKFSEYSGNLNPYIKGFRAGINQLTHVTSHLTCKTLVKMDIKNFFDSITLRNILGNNQILKVLHTAFELQTGLTFNPENFKYRWMYDALSEYYHILNISIISILCFFTHNGCVPTGAKYSPVISNMILAPFDHWLVNTYLKNKSEVIYTRFADDIALSTINGKINGEYNLSIKDCTAIDNWLHEYGYMLNYKKTKIMPPGSTKTMFGLIIDQSNPDKPILTLGHGRKLEMMQILSDNSISELSESDQGTMAWIRAFNQDYHDRMIESARTHFGSRNNSTADPNEMME